MSNAEIVKEFYGKLSQGDVSGAAGMCTPDATMTIPGAHIEGREGFMQMIGGYNTAFPGFRIEIIKSLEQGDTVAVEGVWRGQNSGPMMMPDGASMGPTGKKVEAPFAAIFTVKDGMVAAHNEYWDLGGFMAQLN